jgi:hypothetical protein
MGKTLTPKTRVDSLKKQAKAWLKAVRMGEAPGLARLAAAWPNAPALPTLRDIQHALALEYGQRDWIHLKTTLSDMALDQQARSERVDTLLRHAWGGDLSVARRILERDPSITRDTLATAVVCGDQAEVNRRLAADPDAANRKLGPLNWPPLLYLAFSRLPGQAAGDAVAIAASLLNHGADPNAEFNDGWDNPFKVLTGIIGQGEDVQPTHEQAAELAALLIERGAEPYDTQALYNTSIVGDDITWLRALYGYAEQRGETARWNDPAWKPNLGGKLRLGTLDYLIGNAVGQNHLVRAAWLLDHGANPNTPHAYSGQPVHAVAQLSGFGAMAALLERYGAKPVTLKGLEAFQAACLRGDEAAARALLAPAYLRDPGPLLTAAELGRADAVALLLTLGAPANGLGPDDISPLHRAVQSGSAAAVESLLAAGADVNQREKRWRGTALSWAGVLGRYSLIERLESLSHDARSLTSLCRFGRLEDVLGAHPDLANQVVGGNTPLFCLPDEESHAVDAVKILLDHGARPDFRNAEGRTAADAARKRGLDEAADLLDGARG